MILKVPVIEGKVTQKITVNTVTLLRGTGNMHGWIHLKVQKHTHKKKTDKIISND